MPSLPDFVIAGIPLVVVILVLVEEIKAWGVAGNILRAVSLVIGLAFSVAFQLATKIPTTLMEWLVVVVVGLLYGVAASGTYDFISNRIPSKV